MFKKGIKKESKNFLKEFREFTSRGNALDLAVGVIIGAAFQSIVNSMVKDVIMPFIGWIFGDMDFSKFFIILGKIPESADMSKLHSLSYVRDTLDIAVFAYGAFITAILNFAITAFGVFLIVKGINSIKKLSLTKKEEQPAAPKTKVCPYCLSEIKAGAIRCPFCTETLETGESE